MWRPHSGHLNRETWNDALRSQGVTGLLPGEVLMAGGALSPEQFRAGMLARAERITQNLMGMNFGKFTFHPYPELKKIFPFDQLDLLSLLLSHNRKAISRLLDEDLYKQTEELYKLHVRPTSGREKLLETLLLNGAENHVAKVVIPAGWPLAQMLSLREMEERALLRLILVLKAVGLVEFVAEEGPKSKRNRAERFLYESMRDLNRRTAFDAQQMVMMATVAQLVVQIALFQQYPAQDAGVDQNLEGAIHSSAAQMRQFLA
mgnify:CR=1 FL=1